MRAKRKARRCSAFFGATGFLLFPALFLLSVYAAEGAVEPKLDEITLEWRGKVLHPVGIEKSPRLEYQCGQHTLTVSNDTLSALDPSTRKILWTATDPETTPLRWLSGDGDVAYLQGTRLDKHGEVQGEKVPKVKRLDLRSGKWLPDFSVNGAQDDEFILEAIAGHDLVLLITINSAGGQMAQNKPRYYRICCLEGKDGNLVWTKTYQMADELAPPGAYLLSARLPSEAMAEIRHLSWLGDQVLACAGPRQDLICLDPKTGEIRWSVENIWEFERGFIGPSVWAHFISRFGTRKPFGTNAVSVDAKTRKTFESRWRCEVVGGPIVVKHRRSSGQPDGASLFVAVAKASAEGDRERWANYLSDCVIYELSDSGEPLSMAHLPRMVEGSNARVVGDGLVWLCQNNAAANLQAIQSPTDPDIGPGGPDFLTKVVWYREFDAAVSEAWLTTGKSGDPVAFGPSRLYRVTTGGYVNQRGDQTINLPLIETDYGTGTEAKMFLRVPLPAPVPLPKSNYSQVGDSYRTIGPYFLSVTDLEAAGDILSITLGMENWSATATFNLR